MVIGVDPNKTSHTRRRSTQQRTRRCRRCGSMPALLAIDSCCAGALNWRIGQTQTNAKRSHSGSVVESRMGSDEASDDFLPGQA